MLKPAAIVNDAESHVLADRDFRAVHQAKLQSTDPLERFNGEVKRRTEVVGIFPNKAMVTTRRRYAHGGLASCCR